METDTFLLVWRRNWVCWLPLLPFENVLSSLHLFGCYQSPSCPGIGELADTLNVFAIYLQSSDLHWWYSFPTLKANFLACSFQILQSHSHHASTMQCHPRNPSLSAVCLWPSRSLCRFLFGASGSPSPNQTIVDITQPCLTPVITRNHSMHLSSTFTQHSLYYIIYYYIWYIILY